MGHIPDKSSAWVTPPCNGFTVDRGVNFILNSLPMEHLEPFKSARDRMLVRPRIYVPFLSNIPKLVLHRHVNRPIDTCPSSAIY